jgi:hypothetical protein
MEITSEDREDCTQNDLLIDGFKISTWYSEGVDDPYYAVNMTVACKFLEKYNLSEEEKTSLPALSAGYCRLLDEYGMAGYGTTELDAINDLFKKAERYTVD